MGCASAIASLDLLESDECVDAMKRIASRHTEFAKELREGKFAGLLEDVRLKGSVLAIELKVDKSGYESEVRNTLYSHFISQGVLLRPLGNVIYILPPYCITDEELDKVYKSVLSALERIAI